MCSQERFPGNGLLEQSPRNDVLLGTDRNGVYIWTGARIGSLLQRLSFSSDCHSPAPSPLQHLNGHPWHLNGQPQEPDMEAFWSLKLLPIVPNVAFSGYGFVPLLPGARTATLCGKNFSGVGIL
jgi:hypothetical protein